ncbi:pirin family protein [Chitinophaga sp. NPDC101104]|uniref:pirin family protein n=1 Tax=Chitinophaga sp. NPDC101104 TaxID=3390561 RepID=UPI003D0790B5
MTHTTKQVAHVYQGAQPHMVGDGFRVQNLFPGGNKMIGKQLSPFFLLDYAAPHYFAPSETPRGVEEHPHRGFETVTIAYQGALEHRDSGGNSGKIGPGDVQWMTAASGVVHEEKHESEFTRNGGILEMAQLWVNLPKAHKMDKPGYQSIVNADIPVADLGNGSYARVIAGNLDSVNGPAKTFTPINLFDIRLTAGTETTLTLPDGFNTGIVVLKGAVTINGTHAAKAVEIAVFEQAGETITLKAEEDTTLLVLNGEPIRESIFAYGPFVMNNKEEIITAIDDYNNGKMGRLN